MTPQTTEPIALTRKDLEEQLVARAWEDEAFKAALLADPKGVIQREADREYPGLLAFPPDVRVHVCEETPTDLYIVLPVRPEVGAERELSDADLQLVAGASAETNNICDIQYTACGGAGTLIWRR